MSTRHKKVIARKFEINATAEPGTSDRQIRHRDYELELDWEHPKFANRRLNLTALAHLRTNDLTRTYSTKLLYPTQSISLILPPLCTSPNHHPLPLRPLQNNIIPP